MVKTRLQSSSKSTIKSVDGRRRDYLIKNVFQILRKEGWRALFKGLPITLTGVVPSRFVYFYSYNGTKSFINENTKTAHILSVRIIKNEFKIVALCIMHWLCNALSSGLDTWLLITLCIGLHFAGRAWRLGLSADGHLKGSEHGISTKGVGPEEIAR